MRFLFAALSLAASLTVPATFVHAQAPSSAPAGANGICKDGTYSNAASKDGACRGHKGVQTWYAAAAAPAPTPATSAPSMPAPKPATAGASLPAPTPATSAPPAATAPRRSPGALANQPAAAGGGPGLVWVNSSTNVYHCNGDDFYGKTKKGAYMSEADARSKGARAARGQACTGK